MYDHFKPTTWEFNQDHITLQVGTNELKNRKKVSQISTSAIDLALSLKSETNTVTTSLIVPRKNTLNNKAQEVNSRLITMCGERDITFIDHTDTISTEIYFNESKVYLNKSGTIEFDKNVSELSLQQDWFDADNSGNTALASEKISTVSGVINWIPEDNINHEVNQSDFFVTLVINMYGGIKFLTLSRLGRGLVGPQTWTFFNNFLMRYRIDLKFFDFS